MEMARKDRFSRMKSMLQVPNRLCQSPNDYSGDNELGIHVRKAEKYRQVIGNLKTKRKDLIQSFRAYDMINSTSGLSRAKLKHKRRMTVPTRLFDFLVKKSLRFSSCFSFLKGSKDYSMICAGLEDFSRNFNLCPKMDTVRFREL